MRALEKVRNMRYHRVDPAKFNGAKYVVAYDYVAKTSHKGYYYNGEHLRLLKGGFLTIWAGFPSDGPSGPTKDDETNMRGAIIHDAEYKLHRLGVFGPPNSKTWKQARARADRDFRKRLEEDGMPWWRRWYYYWSVRLAPVAWRAAGWSM